MKEYLVISAFNDLLDNGRLYKLGSVYPRKGYTPTEQRITELLGSSNKQHKPLIKEIKAKPPTRKNQGGNKNENK